MSLGFDALFQPGLRHWREYIDMERMRVNVKPALGRGPKGGPVDIDLKTGAVVIDEAAIQREEDVRQQRRSGLA
ncbi:MAG: hypothetical protein FWD80_06410 [Propionibacteriaceae bacterium]|nr:hypothetical protein [Propionibacteriaceae bacterium]